MALKVANIIEEGRLGGPQIRICGVAQKLKSMGIETVVFYPELDSERFEKYLEDYEIKNIQLPIHRLTRSPWALFKYFLNFIYEIFLIYRAFKKENFDLIHVSGGALQFKGILAGKAAGCKVIWHLNDTYKPIIFRYFLKILCHRLVDGVIVAGERVKKYYINYLNAIKKPVYHIQAPVNTSIFKPKLTTSRSVLNKSGINIVTVGNINPAKGYECFIEMASLLKDEKALNFYIVGPHLVSQKAYSKKLLKMKENLGLKQLFFNGASDNIRDILSETDVYVCSSITEASPISVWEAMSMGKAIVSTDVGDVPRYIEDGKNGFIVPFDYPEKMAEKVKYLVGNPCLRKSFGRKARQAAVKKLDVEIIAEKQKKSYLSIINSLE